MSFVVGDGNIVWPLWSSILSACLISFIEDTWSQESVFDGYGTRGTNSIRRDSNFIEHTSECNEKFAKYSNQNEDNFIDFI